MKTIKIEIPVCECGCEGDMLIQLSDGVLDFVVCSVCGCKLGSTNKKLNTDTIECDKCGYDGRPRYACPACGDYK